MHIEDGKMILIQQEVEFNRLLVDDNVNWFNELHRYFAY